MLSQFPNEGDKQTCLSFWAAPIIMTGKVQMFPFLNFLPIFIDKISYNNT